MAPPTSEHRDSSGSMLKQLHGGSSRIGNQEPYDACTHKPTSRRIAETAHHHLPAKEAQARTRSTELGEKASPRACYQKWKNAGHRSVGAKRIAMTNVPKTARASLSLGACSRKRIHKPIDQARHHEESSWPSAMENQAHAKRWLTMRSKAIILKMLTCNKHG